jgi:uncharacterized integral membrane protein
MPWRLILVIVIFAIFLAFITFNLDNRCDISFGFTTITNIPVFLTVFISFTLGLFCVLPIALLLRKKQKEIPSKDKKPLKIDTPAEKRGSDGRLHDGN